MIDTAQNLQRVQALGRGPNSHRLIDSPWTMAAELVRLHIAAMDGVTLSFVKFNDELRS